MDKAERQEAVAILTTINKQREDCKCYSDIVIVARSHYICGKCMKDISHEIAIMSEDTYNSIKKNIRLGINYKQKNTL